MSESLGLIGELRERISERDDEIRGLEGKLATVEHDYYKLDTEARELRAEAAALGAAVDNLNATVFDLATHGRDLEARLATVTADFVAICGALPAWCGEGSIAQRVTRVVEVAERRWRSRNA